MQTKLKTLIIITPGFPATDNDSSCLPLQQALTRAIHLQFPEIRTVVISLHYPFHQKIYSCAGALVYAMAGRNRGHLFKWLLRRKVMLKLKALYRESEVIGLLSFWYGECAFIAEGFSKISSLKHFCWLLGQDAKSGNKYPSLVQLHSAQLVGLSDFLKAEFFKNYGLSPDHVITPGLELKNYSVPSRQRDIDILGVGSLIPLKQFEIFLDMVASVKSRFHNIRCVIIGKGPELGKLQGKIVRLGLAGHVFLLGEMAHAKVLECMSRTKILLHTSSYEGFSGVCMEALAAGANVVSFTRAMNYEIDQWHVVSGKNEMVNKLISLLHHSENRRIFDFPIERTAWEMLELFGEKPTVATWT